jgi:hypothetical protein
MMDFPINNNNNKLDAKLKGETCLWLAYNNPPIPFIAISLPP